MCLKYGPTGKIFVQFETDRQPEPSNFLHVGFPGVVRMEFKLGVVHERRKEPKEENAYSLEERKEEDNGIIYQKLLSIDDLTRRVS